MNFYAAGKPYLGPWSKDGFTPDLVAVPVVLDNAVQRGRQLKLEHRPRWLHQHGHLHLQRNMHGWHGTCGAPPNLKANSDR